MAFSRIEATPGMDLAALANVVNENFRQLEAENRTKVVRDETGVDRIVFGKYEDGRYGMKVSAPTKDVKTATGTDLIFNSAQNILKVAKTGTFTTSAYTIMSAAGQYRTSTGGGVAPVAHGLGKAPAVIAFMESGGQYSLLPRTITNAYGVDAMITRNISVNVDATNIYFLDVTTTFGAVPAPDNTANALNIKYYLLEESAA